MRKLPNILGITGNIGAGKNEVAKWFNRQGGYTIRGYSDPLYEQLATLNPYIQASEDSNVSGRYNTLVAILGVDTVKRRYPEVRRFLRYLGSECGRDIHGQDCWLKVMDDRRKDDRRTVIQGVRFKNEVDHIKAQGGLIFRVKSPFETPPDRGHISEFAIDPIGVADWTILNDASLDDLHAVLDKFFGDTL